MTAPSNHPEIAALSRPAGMSTSPGIVRNGNPAPISIIAANVRPGGNWDRSPPPCCICGASSPFGFRVLYGPTAKRQYFGSCRAHHDIVLGIYQGTIKIVEPDK